MYKYVSVIFLVVVVFLGGMLYFEKRAHADSKKELSNEIAKLEGVVQETETAFSRRAIEVRNLKSENKELQVKIKDREEDIIALTEANIVIKKKLIKIENANQIVVNQEGEEVPPDPSCDDCFAESRFKVEFEKEVDPYRVKGFTLTNPAYAELSVEWMRDLELEVILTKDDDGNFRAYLDSKDKEIVPAELKLQVDPTVLKRKWYENIGIGSDLMFGKHGGTFSIKLFYEIMEQWYLGPSFMVMYDGKKAKTFYGITAGWYMFRW